MKPVWLAAALVAAMALAQQALAQDGADLAKAKGCLNCHALDQKKAGPAFKDIAAKYAGNADAESTLIAKLKDGKGHMKIAASDADLKTLVDYVLSTH